MEIATTFLALDRSFHEDRITPGGHQPGLHDGGSALGD